MSAERTYTIGPFTLRPVTEEDLGLARIWTDADATHRGIMAPQFWTEQSTGVDCYILTDSEGPLFFFRMQRAVRLFIQFAPADTPNHDTRTREGMAHGLRWLSMALGAVAVSEIIFDSASKLLRRYVTGYLNFAARPETLSRGVQVLSQPPRGGVVIPGRGECVVEQH